MDSREPLFDHSEWPTWILALVLWLDVVIFSIGRVRMEVIGLKLGAVLIERES